MVNITTPLNSSPVSLPLPFTELLPVSSAPKEPRSPTEKLMHRPGESTMRALVYGGKTTDRKKIQSYNSSVKFESLPSSDTRDEITYLSNKHEEWLANSGLYAKLITEATAGEKSIRIQINDEKADGADVTWNENAREHLIEINPLGHEVNAIALHTSP